MLAGPRGFLGFATVDNVTSYPRIGEARVQSMAKCYRSNLDSLLSSFAGSIPTELGTLAKLQKLALSLNKLTGKRELSVNF